MSEKIRAWVVDFSNWAEKNHLALIFGAGAYILLFFTLWSLSLLVGFWSNAILATKFELSIGMAGITAIGTAVATIYGVARAAQAKYDTDSKFNSEDKKPVYDKIINGGK